MTTKVAPWLQGIDGAWEAPAGATVSRNMSSASRDAGRLPSGQGRIPRLSLSGLGSLTGQRQSSTYKRRHPLAPLDDNESNAPRRDGATVNAAGTQSTSGLWDGSMCFAGTVQQRSKSASPIKSQETLEWKRRLVRGQVGYGDQTDLFGPSGLENIFSRSKGADNDELQRKKRINWLTKADRQIPSSPPPWPSNTNSQKGHAGEKVTGPFSRNPTPSQRRQLQIELALKQCTDAFVEQGPEKLEAVMEHIESSMVSGTPPSLQQQAKRLASEVAAFTLNVRRPSSKYLDGDRKRSVTTQDFLNEAMMVMNLIRAKARPQSLPGSVEESDAEAFVGAEQQDTSETQASGLSLSRPPSREGGNGWRTRGLARIDQRVASHLKKFQEQEELDDTGFIGDSVSSLDPAESSVPDDVGVEDMGSNIRISGPAAILANDPDSHHNSHRSQESTDHTQSTKRSAGESTGRTIATNSTRKSDNVGTLAPDQVVHLIGEQVGGMTFDKEKQRWVRLSKSPEKKRAHGSFLELPSNVTSDDDPFREISDLPVDEQKELRRISSPGKLEHGIAKDCNGVRDVEVRDQPIPQDVVSRTTSDETVVPRPVTRDGSQMNYVASSSAPSRYTVCTALASSQLEKVETRATSWSSGGNAAMPAPTTTQNAKPQETLPTALDTDEAVEPRENLNASSRSPSNHRGPQDIDPADHDGVSASLSSCGSDDIPSDDVSGLGGSEGAATGAAAVLDLVSPKLRQTPIKAPSPICQTATRQLSLRKQTLTKQTLTNRFHAEVHHEHSELSVIAPLPGDRVMSLQLSVSRPSMRQTDRQVADLQSSPTKDPNRTLLWSDLPEFTVHEEDVPRPSERALSIRLARHAASEINDRYALAVKDLVKTLTDVNEDEPYWEDVKRLDLQGRSLSSLHGLDEFCPRVQDMNVANNVLSHIRGAPYTVRRLNARRNCLTDLTSWEPLVNLHFLDVSSNALSSLDGMASLIHLRELVADDNKIQDITGVFCLDGLVKLRLRRNQLSTINFLGAQMSYLTHLDLSGNHISHVEHLDNLVLLNNLKLDDNLLEHGLVVPSNLAHMKSLSLVNCGLTHLDVSKFPGLEFLNVDDNKLATITGIRDTKNLRLLSMQRQTLPGGGAISVFDEAFEATTVRLSGNAIPSLRIHTNFLSIRHLELASAGLQHLPDDFGLRMPNLRTLNLNFNIVKDVRPLLNIQRLEHLSLHGNCVSRLRRTVATFARLPTLQSLDLRDNPLTQGFYVSLASTLSRHTTLIRRLGLHTSGYDDDDDVQAECLEKARYELPAGDCGLDYTHRSRMNEDTRLRRRVYELLMANGCPELRLLDGLNFDKANAVVKDGVWDRLVVLGVIRKSQPLLE